MATTDETTLSGSWEVLYTNSGAVNVPIVMTSRERGLRWAVKNNATPPAESLDGHIIPRNEDKERIVEPGETLFVNGGSGAILTHSGVS